MVKTKRYPLSQMKQQGFTLVELAVVLAIIAFLAAWLLPGLNQSKDDAKYQTALSQLEKDFPSAITRQIARTNSCSATTVTQALLIARGLPAQTVWSTPWTVSSVTSNTVTINYTIDSNDANAAIDMATNLATSNNIVSATNTGNSSVTVAYRCN